MHGFSTPIWQREPMENDLTLMRLQYEILNVPIETLAAQANCPPSILQSEADKHGWTQYWPEPDLELVQEQNKDNDEDALTSEAEILLERSKRRLAIYNVAKEMLLAQRYLALESALITKATSVVENAESSSDLRSLSTVFKDLTAKSISGAMAALSFGQDEGGLPTVVIRDLTGQK